MNLSVDIATGQVAFLWLATALYAASSVMFVAAATFKRGESWLVWSCRLVSFGLLPHAIAIVLRWIEVGHGPYVTFYEVASSDTWVAVVTFVLVSSRFPRMRPAGAIVLPISFLLIGAAVLSPREGRELLPVLNSFWLIVHVVFAKLAYGPYLLGLGAAVLYLWTGRNNQLEANHQRRSVDPALLDELSYRFIAFGFAMHAVMIIAGAIWANYAWGSYWSWDAIETWSLISWLAFAILLHLRALHGWHGGRAALATIAAVVLVIFAFFAVPFFGGSHQLLLAF